jgi:hypothetical protein
MIEARIQLLLIQVQTGRLTEEGYANNLKNKIVEERQRVKALLAQGKKDGARLALQRAKLMEKELTETQAEGEE